MKKLLTVAILTISFTTLIFGQDKAEDLKKLFVLMQSEKMVDNMMDNILPMISQQAESQLQGDDAREQYNKYMEFVMEETKKMTKKVINVEMVSIYDKYFTHEEIKDLIVFYESPTGKKLLEKTPELTKELMEIMMNKYMPEYQEKLMEGLENMK